MARRKMTTEERRVWERVSRHIRAELVRRGLTQTDVARMAGVSQPTVCNTVYGHESNAKVRRVIAFLLEQPEADIFAPRRARAQSAT